MRSHLGRILTIPTAFHTLPSQLVPIMKWNTRAPYTSRISGLPVRENIDKFSVLELTCIDPTPRVMDEAKFFIRAGPGGLGQSS